MSNLNDYPLFSSPPYQGGDCPSAVEGQKGLLEIDRWILLRLNRLVEKVTKAYDEFELHVVYHALYDFCVNDLSALYLDMSKDRLYCGGKDSTPRRSAQFAMQEILMTLVKLMAPILSFTAEDILKHMKSKPQTSNFQINPNSELPTSNSVFLLEMPKPDKNFLDENLEAKWEVIWGVRERVYRELEKKRAAKEIGGGIEAQVEIFSEGNELEILRSIEKILPMVFIVAKVILSEGKGDPIVSHSTGKKCVRCWIWSETVGSHKEHPELCERCGRVVAAI